MVALGIELHIGWTTGKIARHSQPCNKTRTVVTIYLAYNPLPFVKRCTTRFKRWHWVCGVVVKCEFEGKKNEMPHGARGLLRCYHYADQSGKSWKLFVFNECRRTTWNGGGIARSAYCTQAAAPRRPTPEREKFKKKKNSNAICLRAKNRQHDSRRASLVCNPFADADMLLAVTRPRYKSPTVTVNTLFFFQNRLLKIEIFFSFF